MMGGGGGGGGNLALKRPAVDKTEYQLFKCMHVENLDASFIVCCCWLLFFLFFFFCIKWSELGLYML